MRGDGGYHQFCPVALAAEVACARWTPLILRDLFGGSTRFNELQRGVPRMSTALLAKRLKEMEATGLIERRPGDQGGPEYHLTAAGRDLLPLIEALGSWGLRHVDPEVTLQKLDAPLLMWKIRGGLDPSPPPPGRCTIEFNFPDAPVRSRRFWLIVEAAGVDLCATDPGFPTDVYVTAHLRAVTAVWLGLADPREEIESGRIEISGTIALVRLVCRWLGESPAARARRQLAA